MKKEIQKITKWLRVQNIILAFLWFIIYALVVAVGKLVKIVERLIE